MTEHLHVPGEVDMVLHFASPASPVDYLELPIHTLKVGSIGTLHALGLAKAHDARFLIASTSEVYGDPLVHPQPESYWGNSNPVGPRGVYDEAKRFAESLTMAYRTTHGVRPPSCGSSTPSGHACARMTGGRYPPSSARRCTMNRSRSPATAPRPVPSATSTTSLKASFAWLHSDHPGPMNIGNPHEISMHDLALLIRELVGSSSEITYVPRPVDDPTVRRPDITLAERELGWRPVVPIEDALLRTIDWCRAQAEFG